MIQTGHCLCFSSETLQRSVRISAITKDALYRDDAPRMSLPGPIDHAHAAATDLLENFVISQPPRLVTRVKLVDGKELPVARERAKALRDKLGV